MTPCVSSFQSPDEQGRTWVCITWFYQAIELELWVNKLKSIVEITSGPLRLPNRGPVRCTKWHLQAQIDIAVWKPKTSRHGISRHSTSLNKFANVHQKETPGYTRPIQAHPGPATGAFRSHGGTHFFGLPFSSVFSGVCFFKSTLPDWGAVFPHDLWKPRVITESRGPAGSHPWPRRSCTCGGRWGRCARSGPSSARALEYLEYGKVPIYKWPKCGYNHGTLQNSNWEWSSFSKGCHSIFRPVDASCLGSCPSVALCILCALTTNGELLPFCCILGTAPQFLSPTLQTMGCRSTVDCTLCKMTHSKQWLSFHIYCTYL